MFINLLSSADWTLSGPAAVRDPGGKTPSWLTCSTCSFGHYLSGEKLYALPTSALSSHSFMPSWHNTIVKPLEKWTSSHRLVFEQVHSIPNYSSCHLLNPHFLAATWLLYILRPSSQNPNWILGAPVIHTYSGVCFCGLLRMDGVMSGMLFTSLHDLFKNLRADAPVGWLNDGWYPQPTCHSPMRRHLCHSVL